MTNAPESRKTHVVRLFGTNKKGEVLTDVYIDLERIDSSKASITGGSLSMFQGVERKYRWLDDPTGNDYAVEGQHPTRETEIVKVCSPDEVDVNNPEEWIEVAVTKQCEINTSENNYQRLVEKIVNDETNELREVVVRRIAHYDTNIDEAVEKAISADPELRSFVVPGEKYIKDEESKDADEFVEHEIILTLISHQNVTQSNGDHSDEEIKTHLLNQYLIDESEKLGRDRVIGLNGINPPYRLDPGQNIINVSFGGAVEFFDRSL
jgi:hypothetical protein